MHRHLVAVEIGIECGTDQRMQLDCLPFDQNRLKRLNAEPMQRRGAVEHNWMFFYNLFQSVPHFGCLFFNHPASALYGGNEPLHLKLMVNKRLEEFDGHLLWQTTLMQFQFRPYNNHRTAGIIYA